MSSNEQELFDEAVVFRKEHFAVKVMSPEHRCWPEGTVMLSVTTNGYSWETTTLLPNEVDAVIEALKAGKWRQQMAQREVEA
jgi:hypothetical protein